MEEEKKQFFDGFLLGALVVGLMIVTIITFFLYQNARKVGEGTPQLTEKIVEVAPTGAEQRKEDQGKSVQVRGEVFVIAHAFHDADKQLMYRSLKDHAGNVYASLWAKNGEQLLYAAEIPLLDAIGASYASVVSIHSPHEIVLMSKANQLFIYDLEKGVVQPWKN